VIKPHAYNGGMITDMKHTFIYLARFALTILVLAALSA